jgi:oligopeptide/dipeptide ABC transporter ATP-binding protein
VSGEPLLSVRDLSVSFATESGRLQAVDGVSFDLSPGEVVAIVGESGSGKSVTAQTIIGLTRSHNSRIEGTVVLHGADLVEASEAELRRVRGQRIGMVFQDPMTSFNPVYRIGNQIVEAIRAHRDVGDSDARDLAVEMLDSVGIPDASRRVDDYPHEFSGGMRQRAMIAMALSLNPDLLIADEPTTALDVTVQAQILDLIDRLKEEFDAAVVMITHDLGVVAEHCDDIMVMYAGKAVEHGEARDIYYNSHHPYTWGLLQSITRIDQDLGDRLRPIQGLPPSLIFVPRGCAFHPRCPYAMDVCTKEIPPLLPSAGHHATACHLSLAEKERIFDQEVAYHR